MANTTMNFDTSHKVLLSSEKCRKSLDLHQQYINKSGHTDSMQRSLDSAVVGGSVVIRS